MDLKRPLLSEKGMTLVELLVGVALFGVLAIGMMSLMSQNSNNLVRNQNQADLSSQLQDFSTAMDALMSNTTQVVNCLCSNSCVYQEPGTGVGGPACTPGTPCTLFDFEYEDANDPSALLSTFTATSKCRLAGNPVIGAPYADNQSLRGCKKQVRLNYTQPVAVSPGPSAPGVLSLVEVATGNVLHQLSGVYAVDCGGVFVSGTTVHQNEEFKIKVRMKAKASNAPPGDPAYEGWALGDIGFGRGILREVTSTVAFRNINVQGVHFGKEYSAQNCTPNGKDDANKNCCSGFWFSGSPQCRDISNCVLAGTPSSDPLSCCSHTLNFGVCL